MPESSPYPAMDLTTDSVRRYLGEEVEVYYGDESGRKLIVSGRLLGFGQGGDFEILCDDGIHYCWPMLEIVPIGRTSGGDPPIIEGPLAGYPGRWVWDSGTSKFHWTIKKPTTDYRGKWVWDAP
jgi:hypothetical protein